MSSPTIAEILDYANLQMAAEAFLANPADPTGLYAVSSGT